MVLPSPDAFDEEGGDEAEDEEEKKRIQEEMERMEEAQQEAEENKKFEFFREPPPKSWWPWGAAPVVDRGPVNAPVAPLGSSSAMAAGGGNAAAAARGNEAAGADSGGGAFGRMFSWLPWSGTTAAGPGTLALPDDETIAIAGADKRRRQGLEIDDQQPTRIGGDRRRAAGALASLTEPEAAAVEGEMGEKKKKKKKTPRAVVEKGELLGRDGYGGPRDIDQAGPASRLRAIEGTGTGTPGEGKEAEEKEDQYTLGSYLMAPLSLMPWSSSTTGGGALGEGEGKEIDYQGVDKGEGVGGEKKKPKASKGKKKEVEEAEEGDEEKGTKGAQNDGEKEGEEVSKEEAKNMAAAVPVKGTIASRAARMMSMFSLSRNTSATAATVGLEKKEGAGEGEGEDEEEEKAQDTVEGASRAARLMAMFSLRRRVGETKVEERGEGEEERENEEGGEEEERKVGGEGEEGEEKKPLSHFQKLKKRLQTEDGEPEDLEVLADRLVGALSNGEINLSTYRMAKRYAKGTLLKKLVEKERERAYKIMKRKERREAEKNMTWGEYFKSKVNLKDLMPKIKILTTVFQIVGGLPATLGISFGGGAGSIFSIFGVVNFGGVSFGSPQCYAAYDYVDRLATTLPYPTLPLNPS